MFMTRLFPFGSSSSHQDQIDYRRVPEDLEAKAGSSPDLEAHQSNSNRGGIRYGAEYEVAPSLKFLCLAIYFTMNIALTLSNKAILLKFPYPWLLTTIHSTSAGLGCTAYFLLSRRERENLSRLKSSDNLLLMAFSTLFTINIAVSNISLTLVSVAFHQIARSLTPVCTVGIYRFFGRSYSTSTYLALLPIILGVALTTYGDYDFTIIGVVLTLSGVLLASIKTIATNRLLTGTLQISPMELLWRMSFLAAIESLLSAYAVGELSEAMAIWRQAQIDGSALLGLGANAIIALVLNISSFQTNRLAGALTLSVCGNIKQCFTVALGILLFDVRVGFGSALGLITALIGAAWYSKVELTAKRQQS